MLTKSSPVPSKRPNVIQKGSISPPGLLDLGLVLSMGAMLLFASWFRSQNRIFWGDEIMGWMVLRQDTWAHLFRVWYGGIDSSGFFFYFFARPWLRLFGPTELALHLFSAFGMALAFALTWLCARRFYSVQLVTAVVPILFLVNRTALWQLANGRTYGVVMAAVGLTCYAFIRSSPEQGAADRRWSLVLTIAASMLLVGSHILGFLYWAAFFAGLLARDAWFRVFRPRVYVCAMAGLTVLILSWKNIVATTALGKPTFWTLRPGFRQLPQGFDDFSHKTGLVLFLAALITAILFIIQRLRRKPEPLFIPERTTLYFLLGSFALIAIGMFAVSKISTPIFVDRYMLPMLIADIFLLCELASRIVRILGISSPIQTAGTLIACVFAGYIYIADLHYEASYPQRDYTSAFLQELPQGEPIVMTAQGTFVEMVFYRNADRRFETPIDWDVQLDPDYGPGGVSGTHELENWRSFGFYADQIRSTQEILADKRGFAVVSDPANTLWMRRYLLNNPAYQVIELPSRHSLRIWQVEKLEHTNRTE